MDTQQNGYLTKMDFDRFEKKLWDRFDTNDAISRGMGERVAVVEARTNTLENRLDTHATDTRKTAAGWGGGVGTAAAAFAYGLFSLWKGHGQ
jgi:hypothetical protein